MKIEYTCDYFPDRDSFQFSAERNPLSETGFWHAFVPHDAVEALGGAHTFATQYAEA